MPKQQIEREDPDPREQGAGNALNNPVPDPEPVSGAKADLDTQHTERTREVARALIREQNRSEYLQALANGEMAPIFLMSGASGAGKSFVIGLLEEIGVEQAKRLISRPRRPDDPDADISWEPANDDDFDTFLTYDKYGDSYGYVRDDFVQRLSDGKGVAVIAGDIGKIAPMTEALQNYVPLAPVVALRIDVPLDVLKMQLAEGREEGFAGEAELRIKSNRALDQWEAAQQPFLKQFYDVHTVINLKDEEHQALGYTEEQLRPMNLELLYDLMDEFVIRAKERSRVRAEEVLKPRSLGYGIPGIPDDLVEVLDTKIAPLAQQTGAIPVLKGGLAAVLYMNGEETPEQIGPELPGKAMPDLITSEGPHDPVDRPVSLDIDWTMPHTIEQVERHRELVQAVTGREPEIKDFNEKAIFHSQKIAEHTEAKSGQDIELDAIVESRVQPEHSPFCFEVEYDDVFNFSRRQAILPSGAEIGVVPPEFLIIEKLVAARGEDLGKFDLRDAAGLMFTQPLDLNLFYRMIEKQKYLPGLDSALPDIPEDIKLPEVAGKLREVGIKSDGLINHVVLRAMRAYEASRDQHTKKNSPFFQVHFSRDNLKRLAFIDSMIIGLDKIEDEIDPEGLLREPLQSLDLERLNDVVDELKNFLIYHAEFQMGRSDFHVDRECDLAPYGERT